MGGGARRATVHGVTESDTTEQLPNETPERALRELVLISRHD